MKIVNEYNDGGATFAITCKECPLAEMLKALDLNRPCASGIQTNMQGPVVVNQCRFWGGSNSLRNDMQGETPILTSECSYQASKTE